MKKLFLFFVISAICSTYAADDEMAKKQIKFIDEFLDMEKEGVVYGSDEGLEERKSLILGPIFDFFNIVQKSDPGAHEERAIAMGQYVCEVMARKLKVIGQNQALSCMLEKPHICTKRMKEQLKIVISKLETIKRFQVENAIPVSTREFFDKRCEEYNRLELRRIALERELICGFDKGFTMKSEELRKQLKVDSSTV